MKRPEPDFKSKLKIPQILELESKLEIRPKPYRKSKLMMHAGPGARVKLKMLKEQEPEFEIRPEFELKSKRTST